VGVEGLVAKAMIDDDGIAITLTVADKNDFAVAGSEDVGAAGSGEIHTLVEAADMVDGVDTPAVT